MINLPKIPSNQRQIPLEIQKKGNHFTYIKVFNSQDLKVYNLPLKKAAFFSLSSLKFRAVSLFQGKKVVVLKLYDPSTRTKFTKYLARVEDIAVVSNLTASQIKDLNKQEELEAKLSSLNFKAVDTLVKKVLNGKEVKDKSLQRQIQKLKNSDRETLKLLEVLGKRININTKIDEKKFKKLLKKTFQEAKFIKKYWLSQDEFDQLKILEPYVPFKNIERLLRIANRVEHPRIFKTLIRASEILKNGLPSETVYRKKTHFKENKAVESYSFTITKKGELIIATTFLTAGAFKKVHNAINLSNNELMVKLVVRGKENVESLIKEQNIRENLYKSHNPYIIKPTKIHVLTRTHSDEPIHSPFAHKKYVFFEKRMQDGKSISPKNLKAIAQFCHDYAKGLDIMHNGNPKYVHSDVKPENGLIKEGRAFVSDFGMVQKNGKEIKGGTLFYLPPEYLKRTANGVDFKKSLPNASPSLDSYSLGMTIFCMLDPNFSKQNYYGFLTEREKKVRMDNLLKKFPVEKFSKAKRRQIKKLIQLADKLSNPTPNLRPTCGQVALEIAALFPTIDSSNPS